MGSCIDHYMDMPCMSLKDRIITDVNTLFLELLCLSRKDLMGILLGFVWNDLLHISVGPGFTDRYQELRLDKKFLFVEHL